MVDTINSRDVKIFTDPSCPTGGSSFGKFMRVFNLSMGLINKQDFGITCKVFKDLLERC